MTLVTAEQLLKPVPLKDETVSIDGMGDVRIIELGLSKMGKLTSWLFVDGKISRQRQTFYGLKLATLCLVDEHGELLFDFPDTKAGNKAFFEFAKPIGDGGAGHWSEIIKEARRVNGDVDEVDEEPLLEK